MKRCDTNYTDMIALPNLLHAWEEFLRGKHTRTDVVLFQNRLMDNIIVLSTDLQNKTYRHGAYHAFNISDPKPRNIHKATVRDRLVHHLLYQSLYPYFDTTFIHDSYSCRVDKGAHRAMDRFRDFGLIVSKNNTRTCWVLKCDIRKFFANIDHRILFALLEKHISDADIVRLLRTIISSFHTAGRSGVGLPLGNLTSQLLVNIYMNTFDQFVKRVLKCRHYIRYADDFVFLHEDRNYLQTLIPEITEFLQAQLRLSLHPDKLFLKTMVSGVDFLGWAHFPHHRVLRTATKHRMMRTIKNNPENEAVLNSYRGMVSHGNGYTLMRGIEIVG